MRFKENTMKLVTWDDFSVRRENFRLGDGRDLLRIVAGLFLFPHALSKFADGGLNPAIVGFFQMAGFQPAEAFVYLAAGVELLAGAMLVLGVCTRWAALAAAGTLLMAAYSLYQVGGFKWLWNGGGFEYPIFWAITCLSIALVEFRKG